MCEDATSATAPTMAIMRAAPTMEVRRTCGNKEVNPHVEKLCLCPPKSREHEEQEMFGAAPRKPHPILSHHTEFGGF